jgi:D-alanyl-D-alanine carboxypeptidase
MRRSISVVVGAVVVAAYVASAPSPAQAGPADPAITADRAAVYDPLANQYRYLKTGSPAGAAMASTAKVMTIIVALDAVAAGQANLAEHIAFSEVAAATGCNCFNDVDGTIEAGDEMTLHDALYATAISDGEPTVAVAEHIAAAVLGPAHPDVVDDPVQAFIGLMNDKAAKLGLADTHFETPHGGDADGQVISAASLAGLWEAGVEEHSFHFLDILGWWTHDLKVFHGGGLIGIPYPASNWHGYYPGVEGSKGGNSAWCPECWVASAKRLSRRLIVTDMQSDNNVADAAELFRWGYADLFRPHRKGESGDLDKINDQVIDCSGNGVVSALKTNTNTLTLRGFTANADAGTVVPVAAEVFATGEAITEVDIARVSKQYVATVHRTPAGNVFVRTWRWAGGKPVLVDFEPLSDSTILRVIRLSDTRILVARRTDTGTRLLTLAVSSNGNLTIEDQHDTTGLISELDVAANVTGTEVMTAVRRTNDGVMVLRTFSIAGNGMIAALDEEVRGKATSIRVSYVGNGWTDQLGQHEQYQDRWATSYVRSTADLGLSFWGTTAGAINLAGSWGDAGDPALETAVTAAGVTGTGAVSAYQGADGYLYADVADYDWDHPGPLTWTHYRMAGNLVAGTATQVEVCRVPTSAAAAQVASVRTVEGKLKLLVIREADKP